MKNIAWAICLFMFLSRQAGAQPLYDTPVYDPSSKSYFALLWVHDEDRGFHKAMEWIDAYNDAKTRTFQGVRGRLAIVSSVDTHQFLYLTFRPDTPAWIGLRYMCEERVVRDSLGRDSTHPPFQAWARHWRQDPFICNINPATKRYEPGDYAPIAYSELERGFRWIGKGQHKGYDAYFIEYPTGHP